MISDLDREREQAKESKYWATCAHCGKQVWRKAAEVGADGVSLYHAICYRQVTREGEPSP